MDSSSNSVGSRQAVPEIVVRYFVHRFLSGQLTSWRDVAYRLAPTLSAQAVLDARRAAALILHPGIAQPLLLRTAALIRPPTAGHEALQRTIAGLRQFTFPLEQMISPGELHDVRRVLDTSFYPSLTSRSRMATAVPAELSSDPDSLVKKLARWFKTSYMSWADPIKCRACGSSTTAHGLAESSAEERADGAGRVELHRCDKCGVVERFARYGSVKALLRERRGRCGEWAHLFYVFLLAARVQARYIWNSEDHVWCEYWSPAKRHWVHVDPSEASVDEPLLYAKGWGKKQAFCLAFGRTGCEDVTRVCVDDWTACLERRKTRQWGERTLQKALFAETVRLRLAMPRESRSQLDVMDEQQAEWVRRADERARDGAQELGGRTSGPAEWRQARGEAGLASAATPRYTVVRTIQPLGAPALTPITTFGPVQPRQSVRLTDGPSQTSAIFADERISADQSFRCVLDFRITVPEGSGGADGMALVFSREKRVGEGGFGLGYHGIGGEGDFAVEIDTYRSQDHADDPPTPHISIHSPPMAHHDHSLACTETGAVPALGNALWSLEVLYTASRRQVIVSLAEAVPRERSYIQMVQADIPLGGNEWFCGVTAATGGLWQIHEVDQWTLEYVNVGGVNGSSDLAAETDDV